MVNKNFMKMVKRQMNSELPVERTTTKKESGLAQILEMDKNGKPELNLTPMEKTAVSTRTQEDYWELMRVYECGRWKWHDGDLPTSCNVFDKYEKETCMCAGVDYTSEKSGTFGYGKEQFYLQGGWEIISTKEFYKKQNVSSEMRKEIKKWFGENGK